MFSLECVSELKLFKWTEMSYCSSHTEGKHVAVMEAFHQQVAASDLRKTTNVSNLKCSKSLLMILLILDCDAGRGL